MLLLIYVLYLCIFFFKQKTAYEMRISDWSSDVCSSIAGGNCPVLPVTTGLAEIDEAWFSVSPVIANSSIPASEIAALTQCQVCSCFSQNARAFRFLRGCRCFAAPPSRPASRLWRSDERRVGKGCVRTCRSRW